MKSGTSKETGTWTSYASHSALRIDGDIDHDGREDIAIQGEMLVGGWEENQLRVYSPWLAPLTLSTRILSPDGGETLIGLSIREIRWLTAVPIMQGQATIDLYYSITSAGDPWNFIASGVPDNGCYQWIVPLENSSNCRIRVAAGTTIDTVEDISDDDFTISGTTGNENSHTGALNSPELIVLPNPVTTVPVLDISQIHGGPITVMVFDISGRMVLNLETESGNLSFPKIELFH